MGDGNGFSCCSFNNNGNGDSSDVNVFFTQTEGDLAIPFGVGTETAVLTLPVVTTKSLQPVKLDGFVQFLGTVTGLSALLGIYQIAARLRVRRDGNLLMTETLRLEGAVQLGLSITQVAHVPISLVDNNTIIGMNTYTVTIEFFTRTPNNNNTQLTAQVRALNALTV